METQWVADRQHLRTLLASRPEWTRQDLAQALGRSLGWVKKWITRLRNAAPDDDTVLQSQSRARKHPPPGLSQIVIDRILARGDDPPQNLKRIPGPKAIRYYLEQEATTTLATQRLPRSTRTIWRILRQHQRIRLLSHRTHQPLERPEPLRHWQLDFKDASTVPADPDGKQQHVVEVQSNRGCRYLHPALRATALRSQWRRRLRQWRPPSRRMGCRTPLPSTGTHAS